jgi:hypothetical protein
MASNFVNGINILDTTNSSGVNSGGSLNVRGGASFSKDIYIGGSVNISGTTTAFSDNIILINQNPINSTDTGFLFERYSEDISNNKKYSGIIYSEVNDQYVFAYLQNEPQKGSITTNGFIGIQSENLTLNSTENSTGVGTGGSLNVLGGCSISKDLHIGGNIYNNGNLISLTQWGLINNNLYYTTGNVGIGTTSPSQKLDVNGTINANSYTGGNISVTNITTGTIRTTNEISTNITTTSLLTTTLNASSGITSGASQFSSLFITSGSLNATFNSNTIGSIITTAGNVGIGTSSPTTNLDIRNSASGISNILTIHGGITGNNNVGSTIRIGGSSGHYSSITGVHESSGLTYLTFGTCPTNGDPVERMRITASGNVSIGTTSPSEKLHIHADSGSSYLRLSASNGQSGIQIGDTSTAWWIYKEGNSANLNWYDGGTNWMTLKHGSGNLGINTTQPGESPYGSVTNALLTIRGSGTDNVGSTILIGGGNGHYSSITGYHINTGVTILDFATCNGPSNPTLRFRIAGNGDLYHYADAKVQFRANTGDGDGRVNINDLGGTAISFYFGTTKVGSITLGASSTAYNTSSDYRLKENVISLENAIDRVIQIPVHRFNFISDPDIIYDGFLAHEVQAIVPEAVTGEKDAVDEEGNIKAQGIDQSKLVPLLTAALKEVNAELQNEKQQHLETKQRLDVLETFIKSKFPGEI